MKPWRKKDEEPYSSDDEFEDELKTRNDLVVGLDLEVPNDAHRSHTWSREVIWMAKACRALCWEWHSGFILLTCSLFLHKIRQWQFEYILYKKCLSCSNVFKIVLLLIVNKIRFMH